MIEIVTITAVIECGKYGALVIEDYLRGAADTAFEL